MVTQRDPTRGASTASVVISSATPTTAKPETFLEMTANRIESNNIRLRNITSQLEDFLVQAEPPQPSETPSTGSSDKPENLPSNSRSRVLDGLDQELQFIEELAVLADRISAIA